MTDVPRCQQGPQKPPGRPQEALWGTIGTSIDLQAHPDARFPHRGPNGFCSICWWLREHEAKLTASIGAYMFAVEGEFSADQILAAFRAWMVARRDPSADLNTLADALTTK